MAANKYLTQLCEQQSLHLDKDSGADVVTDNGVGTVLARTRSIIVTGSNPTQLLYADFNFDREIEPTEYQRPQRQLYQAHIYTRIWYKEDGF